ncbi:neurogenic protein mastermind-like [Haliotis cracherodii]|uniref:neurogenic protein mastermind-like n=1 Tax=Haliotis cracherodii TaxID=6455 RepID=UPI0039ECF873
MGDYSAPKRRDVVDRLRRRLEHYRQHQLGRHRRFNEGYSGLYEEHRQQTQLLHHRWLESKAKKAAKQSKVKQDSSTQGDHRNLVVTKKLKQKIDGTASEPNPAESAYNFDEQESPVNKSSVGGNSCIDNNQLPHLSVKIVQQIKSRPENTQTIHTNVTVSTKTYSSAADSPKPSVSSIHTSVECKQEPPEDTHGHSHTDNQSGQASQDRIFDVGDVEELQNILDTLEKEEGEIPPDIIKELDKFDEIYDNVKVQCESQTDMFGPTIQSPGLSKPFPEPGSGLNMYESNSVVPPPMRNPSMSSMSEGTGPAAETLKQMAAHHQNQSHSPGYPMKSPSIDPYSDPNYQRGNGYVNFQQHQGYSPLQQQQQQQQQQGQSQQAANFPFPPQSHMSDAQSSQYPQHIQNKEMLTYGGTKPLTHFSDHGNGQQQQQPSSLQQLQNQVRTHFNQSPNPQMQITQTQHMQVSHGQHHMQLSQTQQLQMQQPPQQISLTQQQSFMMTPHPPQSQQQQPQMMSEQMNMQQMEKMREQRLHLIEQQQSQSAGQMPAQYMNRPPPEYKVPPVSTPHMHPNASGQFGSTPAGGGPNPLRTMQNMVNQTAYGAVKSEVTSSQTQNGMMQAAHLSAIQSMQSSTVAGGGGAPARPGPMGQQMQRPQYQAGNGPTPPQAAPRSQSTSTYTSAIMRNQRPPNVNVGPDGLNISQPRSAEWPRPMMPGTRHPGQATMTQAAAMSASGMMQYGPYPNSGGPSQTGMMQQQQQQQRPQMNSMPPSQAAMMQNGSQVMMQQQMAQRVTMRPGAAPNSQTTAAYNMSSSVMSGAVPSGGVPTSATQGQSGYPATGSAQDDFMNYLDNAQNTSPDFFDSIVQGDNFNLLDEILGKQ